MALAKFRANRFKIDGKIAENHAILVNLLASIDSSTRCTVTQCECDTTVDCVCDSHCLWSGLSH